MVIAHAVAAAERGDTVIVLIDNGPGARVATSEIRRLARLRSAGGAVGSISLVNTLAVLQRAAGGKYLPDKATMRDVYHRLHGLDDGLPPVETTNLLSGELWP